MFHAQPDYYEQPLSLIPTRNNKAVEEWMERLPHAPPPISPPDFSKQSKHNSSRADSVQDTRRDPRERKSFYTGDPRSQFAPSLPIPSFTPPPSFRSGRAPVFYPRRPDDCYSRINDGTGTKYCLTLDASPSVVPREAARNLSYAALRSILPETTATGGCNDPWYHGRSLNDRTSRIEGFLDPNNENRRKVDTATYTTVHNKRTNVTSHISTCTYDDGTEYSACVRMKGAPSRAPQSRLRSSLAQSAIG